tara:strand:+ start:384 stop:1517 length:1134 start_codon:yes stop_codon:yes gene_type:complete
MVMTPEEQKMMGNAQASQPRGGLLGMFDKAMKTNDETGLSPLQNFAAALDPLIMKDMRAGQNIRQQGAQRASTISKNKTVDMLRKQGRIDLANAVMNGTIGAKEAFSVMQGEKAADTAFRRQQALAGGKSKDTALMRNAISAGLKPGTEEYSKYILSGGDVYGTGAPVEFGPLEKGTMMVQGRDANGNLTYQVVPIPGSQADVDAQRVVTSDQAGKSAQAISGTTVLGDISEMKSLIEKSPYLTTGPVSTVLKKVGYTGAIDVDQLGETIRANIGFDRLQRMRDESPTGGALGQVAVQELNALQASLGSLSTAQSAGRLVENLERLEAQYKRSMQKILATEGGSAYFTQSQIDAINSSSSGAGQTVEINGYTIKKKE